MADRISIFHPSGRLGLGPNPFGKDVANLQLFQALARHGGFSQVDLLSSAGDAAEAEIRRGLLDESSADVRCTSGSILDQAIPAQSGVLLRAQPDIHELAWLRRRSGGDRLYSLIGLVHTLAPPAVRQTIGLSLVAPTRPWDAIVCTSPSVRDALGQLLDDYGDHLAERTSGVRPPQPQLPVIPLGVNGETYAALADRPAVRADVRASLGLAEADVLVLWVGRLSYFEKAFPQPMFKAVQQAARATGAKVCFTLAGWFPAEQDRALFEQAARAHAPDVTVQFVDGNCGRPATSSCRWWTTSRRPSA
jgi:D-inositol-3-phosphate glycosyltransferase